MNPSTVTLVALATSLRVLAQGADQPMAGPKGATVVGIVSSRLGSSVTLVLAQGAAVQPRDQFAVARPALLATVAKDGQRIEAWGGWQEAGRVQIQRLRGERHAIAVVVKENPRTGVDGEPAPNIRAGDMVYVPAAAPPPSTESRVPPTTQGR